MRQHLDKGVSTASKEYSMPPLRRRKRHHGLLHAIMLDEVGVNGIAWRLTSDHCADAAKCLWPYSSLAPQCIVLNSRKSEMKRGVNGIA